MKKTNALQTFQPYKQQKQFLNAGRTFRTRFFMAGNRCGKTYVACMEMAMHLTGRYPKWWKGKRFIHPIKAWSASETTEATRDILQVTLLGGQFEQDFGKGTIPKDALGDITRRQGISNAVDTVKVRHTSGGWSELGFKSYDQGREKFQGTARDIIHLDEEPPYAIFSECGMRTMTTKGHIICTMTPLKGMSDLCVKILDDKDKYTFVARAGWDDVPWFEESDIEAMLANTPPHEKEARRRGIPSVGRGRIFPFSEDEVVVEPFPIPKEWKRFYGMDFGWNNTAAVFFAYDPNSEKYYIYDEYVGKQLNPDENSLALRRLGADWMKGVCDPAGRATAADGKQVMSLYTKSPNSLSLEVADNSVEAGLALCNSLFRAGKLKIFQNCRETLTEFSRYSRDDKGRVVKKHDHLMDAMRYGVMSGAKYGRMSIHKDRRTVSEFVKEVGSWLTV